MNADHGFFKQAGQRDAEPRRPRFVNPKTGQEQSWQRASNFAAPLESPFGLVKHRTRGVVRGINARQDIARMLLAGAVVDDKVDEVISTALAVAEDDAKANSGTAVHAALALCDTGQSVPEEFQPHARGYVSELKRHGLRPVATECRVLNTRLNATGTFDRLYVTDSGKYVIGDIKTGRVDHAHKFAVQTEVYAGGDYLVHPDGTIEPIPWVIDQDTAVLVHVDPETGAAAVYAVPLRVARFGAALAEQVRAFQRMDVLLPYASVPAAPLLQQLHADAAQEAAPRVIEEAKLHSAGPVKVTLAEAIEHGSDQALQDELGMDDGDRAAVLEHVQRAAQSAPAPSVIAGVDLNAPGREKARQTATGVPVGTPEYEARLAELLKPKNDKATLQRMASDLGCRDLAHHRKWLAEWIIRQENVLASGNETAPGTAAATAATIEKDVPAAESTPFLLKQLAEADSVAAIKRIHDNIVQRSGEQAWTQAMQDVAQQRVNELDEDDEAATLGRITAATTTQELGVIWTDVTMNGALPSKWSAKLHERATAQAKKIAESAPPANSNPFGN